MEQKTQRLFSADLLRTLAILGAVCIHLMYPIYSRPDFLGGPTWWLAELINVLSRPAIPLFVMISGYFLLPKQETIPQTIKRTMERLIIPLVFWVLFYFFWELYWFRITAKVPNVVALFQGVLSGGLYHFYFLFLLAELYILLPILRFFWNTAEPLLKKYTVKFLLWASVFHTAIVYALFPGQETSIVTVGIPYLGYFLAGAYFGNQSYTPKQLKKLTVLWIGCVLFALAANYVSLFFFGKNILLLWRKMSYFDDYLSFNVFASSIALFILLLNVPQWFAKQPILRWIVTTMSSLSLGLYAIHLFVTNILDRHFAWQVDFMADSLLSYLIKRTLLTFIISSIIVAVGMRIPYVKKVFGEK